jgi:hypothetical protein
MKKRTPNKIEEYADRNQSEAAYAGQDSNQGLLLKQIRL